MVLLCTARIAEKLDSPVPAKREQTKLENCLPSQEIAQLPDGHNWLSFSAVEISEHGNVK
jgi:hypothetical protein